MGIVRHHEQFVDVGHLSTAYRRVLGVNERGVVSPALLQPRVGEVALRLFGARYRGDQADIAVQSSAVLHGVGFIAIHPEHPVDRRTRDVYGTALSTAVSSVPTDTARRILRGNGISDYDASVQLGELTRHAGRILPQITDTIDPSRLAEHSLAYRSALDRLPPTMRQHITLG